MKYTRPKLLLLLLMALTPLACTKNFAEYNLNPDGVTTPQPAYMFSDALVKTSGLDMEPRTNYCHAFMQYGYNDFWSGTSYTLSDDIARRYWNNFYIPVLQNLEFIMPLLKANTGMVTTYAAARIWRVFIYQKLTDYYGDIPYSQAGKALESGIFTPAYDKQQLIYADLISELRASITLLSNNAPEAVQGDQFYSGSTERWKKLAASLLLRMGMRFIKVDPPQAEALVREAHGYGVMASNSDMPVLKHNINAPNGYAFNLADQHFFLHKTLIDHMRASGDPRLKIYGGVYDKEAFLGGVITSSDTSKFNGYSFNAADPSPNTRVNYAVYQPKDTPFFDFQYAEVEFLLAEAILRGFITGDADMHYQAGITAHMQSLAMLPTAPSISNAQIADYLAKNPMVDVKNPTTERSIERINTEFWVAGFISDADEVYANWRRTGYPKLIPNPNTITGNSNSPGVIPRKIPYPQVEFTLNNANVTSALSAYGGMNDFNEKARVWWDK
ncbi:SusD/RagB family nutrient-binding outer membrane lipoprotein [Mucilaginibacter sp. ZT4R22]|uniref:SusD/RagB family nutrient-binding outer membrane lipoprotein n=1 Tax=Mucilaginibacter pankratovii TaxID=2772110 RepID=A0ABR7WWX8_9SPHI|nr:SusD/RagB family nutrient-binding outer membrane lipoprotein [Mucilaginibacter pankratovii]MBD1366805.1 SusD/RagB family nutrient-binding outer membrane lipoprotein [Mucilaginibacter pankratovii]